MSAIFASASTLSCYSNCSGTVQYMSCDDTHRSCHVLPHQAAAAVVGVNGANQLVCLSNAAVNALCFVLSSTALLWAAGRVRTDALTVDTMA